MFFLFIVIFEHYKLIDRTVTTKEPRHALRAVRAIPPTRKKLNASVLRQLISKYYNGREPTDAANKEVILSFIDEVYFFFSGNCCIL